MNSVIELYEQLSSAPDDKSRARIIAEAFEQIEQRYPAVIDLATGAALRETELRLRKEIEQVRADLTIEIAQVRADLTIEIAQVRADLTKEIEKLRFETREMEGRLQKEIAQVRADLTKEIEKLRFETREMEGRLQKEIEQVRADLTRDIELVRGEVAGVRLEIAHSKVDMIKWTAGLLLAQAALILGGLRYLLG